MMQRLPEKLEEQGLSGGAKQVIQACLKLNTAERGKAAAILPGSPQHELPSPQQLQREGAAAQQEPPARSSHSSDGSHQDPPAAAPPAAAAPSPQPASAVPQPKLTDAVLEAAAAAAVEAVLAKLAAAAARPVDDQPPPELPVGTEVTFQHDGKSLQLRVISLLGRGGWGTVYEVEDVVSGTRWALKVPLAYTRTSNRDGAREEYMEAIARSLQKEATMLQASSQHSPYILRCEASGNLEGGPAEGRGALLLELCECDLAAYLRANGPVPEEQAAKWMEQILKALTAIHGCNLLHRDLKSANILLTRGASEVRLCDFGVAKHLPNFNALAITCNVGTPGNQAPEMLGGMMEQHTTGVDIWSAGIVWWEMLLGRHPNPELLVERSEYKRADLTQRLVQQMPQKMMEHRLSHGAKQVIMVCLRLPPGERGKAAAILERLRKSYPWLLV